MAQANCAEKQTNGADFRLAASRPEITPVLLGPQRLQKRLKIGKTDSRVNYKSRIKEASMHGGPWGDRRPGSTH
jgi:hypothetical protein